MAYLIGKSNLNKAAADELYKSGHHPSVVHCAYYSCVQLMKHIIIHKIGKSEKQIEQDLRQTDQSGRKMNGGVHEYLINILYTNIKSQNMDGTVFNTNITQLKKLRGHADYSDAFNVDSTVSHKSITLANAVIKDLKTKFKI